MSARSVSPFVHEFVVQDLYLMMGREFTQLDQVSVGNIVGMLPLGRLERLLHPLFFVCSHRTIGCSRSEVSHLVNEHLLSIVHWSALRGVAHRSRGDRGQESR